MAYADFSVRDIAGLRNWIAHSKDVTSTRDSSSFPVYNIEGLVEFIGMSRSFFKSYDRLEMMLGRER